MSGNLTIKSRPRCGVRKPGRPNYKKDREEDSQRKSIQLLFSLRRNGNGWT
ncbi:hypothetical protein HJC23_010179 [Cyclotella cryptica]|uniref:Uncharacterized protein n=1 Tax=Cyclotella cryptica TaxID=29204 RepID=A0ABD3PHP5_9STRA